MKALLVEDNADDARMLRASLARSNVKAPDVTRVARLSDGIAALREQQFDVVLLDLNLPDASGRECVEGIQHADPRVPIVVLSGQSDEDYAVEILNRGVQDYLVKWEGDARIIMRSIRYAIERKRAERELKYLARYDSLTGIPNRQYFQDQLQRAVNRARRNGSRLGLLFIDLDRFKTVNDTLGHAIGDCLLKAVVARLQERIRAGDVFARLGGDEFCLLTEDVSSPLEMEALSRKLLAAFDAPFEADGRTVRVTASVGIAIFPNDHNDAMGLLNSADIAMYQAKNNGRNGLQFFTPSMHEEIIEYHRVEVDLKRALAQGEFELAYQPIVSLADGRLHAVEALLRWNHPERGPVPPDRFIAVAEESGYIVPIGLWVFDEVCRQIRRWQEAGLAPPHVAVNVAPAQFRQADFLRQITRIMSRHGVSPSLIELELTESSLMEDTDSIQRCLLALKAEGMRLSIDDFGTGYSCLNYLKTFPIDVIKIDRSFVADLADTRGGRAICGVILSIARSLSLDAIAEGVETAEQLEFLREQGCGYAQGHYFSHPSDPASIAARLVAATPDGGLSGTGQDPTANTVGNT